MKSAFSLDSLPNIVLIVADDLGFNDISVHGNPHIKTKNIDHLAENGINYKNAYCTAPICATSRAAILTGRYQNRYGFEYQIMNRYPKNRLEILGMQFFVNSDPWAIKWTTSTPNKKMQDAQGLPTTAITLADGLKSAGYKTGMFGKWHLGKQKGKLPLDMGFDYHYGFYNSHSLFIPEQTKGYVDTKVNEDWTDQYIWQDQRDGLSAIVINDTIIDEKGYLTDQIANQAVEWITRNKSKPFFAYIPFNAPHTPFQAPQNIYDELAHIQDPVIRTYQAMIKSLDDAVGQIVYCLEKNNLLNNTLIIFTSDNGGARYTTATENGYYKGGKINQFEGGLKVPFITYWKGKINKKLNNERVSTLDIAKTIYEQAGLDNEKLNLDGLNLFSPRISSTSRDLFWQVGHSKCIISGDHKLIFNDGKNQFSRLYNISNDQKETINIANSHPEVIKTLKLKHKRWSDKMEKPKWPGVVNYGVNDDGEILYFES